MIMLDTIIVRLAAGEWLEWSHCPEGWQAHCNSRPAHWKNPGKGKHTLKEFPKLFHLTTGVKVRGNQRPCAVEFSVPRMLQEHNGHLVHSQAAFETALQIAFDVLGEVVQGALLSRFSAVHLVLHLPISPRRVARFVSTAKHPAFRSRKKNPKPKKAGSTMHEASRNCTRLGTGKTLCCYDKPLQMGHGRTNEFCRVELRLSGPYLRRLLSPDGKSAVGSLSFADCYRVYRSFLLGFKGGTEFFGPHLSVEGPLLKDYAPQVRTQPLAATAANERT